MFQIVVLHFCFAVSPSLITHITPQPPPTCFSSFSCFASSSCACVMVPLSLLLYLRSLISTYQVSSSFMHSPASSSLSVSLVSPSSPPPAFASLHCRFYFHPLTNCRERQSTSDCYLIYRGNKPFLFIWLCLVFLI